MVFGAFIAIVLGVRTYRILKGTPVSPWRLFLLATVWVFLFVIVVAEAYFLLPWYTLPGDGVVLVAAAWLSLPLVRREVTVEQRADGTWIYRMGPLVPVVYITLFLVRLAIDAVVLNRSVTSPATVTSLSPGAQFALGAVDAMFAFSTGLLVARSVAVYQELQKRMADPTNAPALSSSPR